jgi:hypothetical protein
MTVRAAAAGSASIQRATYVPGAPGARSWGWVLGRVLGVGPGGWVLGLGPGSLGYVLGSIVGFRAKSDWRAVVVHRHRCRGAVITHSLGA